MATDDRPVSWWFKQAGALAASPAVTALATASPPLPSVGLLAVSGDALNATFIDHAQRSVPSPWKLLGSRTAAAALAELPRTDPTVGSGQQPLLVAFGSGKHGLVVLNLAVIDKIRFIGDGAIAENLAVRWILELLATHPHTSVAATDDLWPGPWTRRLRRATGCAFADVLFVGPKTTYAERTELNQRCGRRALVDMGADSALDPVWSVECEEGGRARLLRGDKQLNDVTIPHTPQSSAGQWPKLVADSLDAERADGKAPEPRRAAVVEENVGVEPVLLDPAPALRDAAEPEAPKPEPTTQSEEETAEVEHNTPDQEASPELARVSGEPTAEPFQVDNGPAAGTTWIWNRILGPGALTPRDGGESHPREKQLEEIICFLQTRRSGATGDELRAMIWGNQVSQSTLLSRISDLRKRLGKAVDGHPALPQQDKTDGKYRLHPDVRSDWDEFDSLVDPIPSRTQTPELKAAMSLVSGPLFGGTPPKPWAGDLRDRVIDRVADAALELSERLRVADELDEALAAARKGLFVNSQRQDLWRSALEAAHASEDLEMIREYQEECRQAITAEQREPQTIRLLRRKPGEK